MADDLNSKFDQFLASVGTATDALTALASTARAASGQGPSANEPSPEPGQAPQSPTAAPQPLQDATGEKRYREFLEGLQRQQEAPGTARVGQGVFAQQAPQPQEEDTPKEKEQDRGLLTSFKELFSKAFLSPEAKAVWDADTRRFEAERAGDIMSAHGREAKAVGSWMQNMNVPGGGALETVGEVVDVLGESVESLRKWNDMLQRSNFQFAEFSAGMAQVEARQEQYDIAMSQRRGDRRAESAQYLAEGRRGLEQKFALGEDTVANQKNWFMGYVDRKVNEVVDTVFPKALQEKLAEWLGVNLQQAGDMDMNEWQQQIADDHVRWDQERGRPPRFNPRR